MWRFSRIVFILGFSFLTTSVGHGLPNNVDASQMDRLDWDQHMGKGFLSVTYLDNQILSMRFLTSYVNAFGWDHLPKERETERLRVWNEYLRRWKETNQMVSFVGIPDCDLETEHKFMVTNEESDWFKLYYTVNCSRITPRGRVKFDFTSPGSNIREVDVTIQVEGNRQSFEILDKGVGEVRF